MAYRVLIVASARAAGDALAADLRTQEGAFEVLSVASPREGLRRLRGERPECLLIAGLGEGEAGLACVARARRIEPTVSIVVVAREATAERAIEALHLGARDVLVGHRASAAEVARALRLAAASTALTRLPGPATPLRALRPSREVRERLAALGLIGESPALLEALAMAERAAAHDVPVFLQGETGTGKDLLARAIHLLGGRRSGPFVAQNCAAFAEGILESELFGHARGAFTGAATSRRGLFEIASGGTLFLDEITEAPPGVQAKLLRAVQEGEVRPLGSERSRRVDVRLIAASNRDPGEAVRRGRLRADLYHRLAVVPIHLPPLRRRWGDVPRLAQHFLASSRARLGRSRPRFEPDALAALEGHDWPGNVRQLRNEIERVLVLNPGRSRISAEMLDLADSAAAPDARPPRPPAAAPLRQILREMERAVILERLRDHRYCRTAAARSLGITREALWAKMRQLGCSAPPRY